MLTRRYGRRMADHNLRISVLVADDNPVVATRVCALLQDIEGVAVVGPAESGAQALDLFHAHAPHVAVLDVHMPPPNGIDVLRTVRATGRGCCVIMLTSDTDPSVREACLAAGADFFLAKAADFERLVEIVEKRMQRAAD